MSNRLFIESLESRALLTAAITATLPTLSVAPSTTSSSINLSNYFTDPSVPANTVFFNTTLGVIPVQLTPSATPLTVQNFLNYVNSGAYTNDIFHRSVPGFIIQAGGYNIVDSQLTAVTTSSPVQNEFSPTRSNLRGTIAMAKTSDPNSATSQFFFNLANNTSLDNPSNSGGFTTFGHIIGNGLAVMDTIAAVPVPTNLFQSPLDELPLVNYTDGTQPTISQLIVINSVTTGSSFAVTSDNDSIATASIQGNQLVYNPLAAGTAHFTVSAAGVDGQIVQQTFTINVTDGPPTTPITLGKGVKSVTFKDSHNTSVTLSLTGPGSATLGFTGTVSSKTVKGITTVTGSSLSLYSLSFTGTSATTTLTLTTKGGKASLDLPSLNSTSPLGTITAPTLNLTGDSSLTSVKSLSLKSLSSTSNLSATSLSKFTIATSLSGSLIANSIGTLSANSLSNAHLLLNSTSLSLTTLAVKTKTISSSIQSAGSLGSLTFTGGISATQIFAGLPADSDPDPSTAAHGSAYIASLKIGSGPKGNVFANSTIAAKLIKSATLGNLLDTPSTSSFYGIEADSILSLTAYLNSKHFSLKSATTPSSLASQLTKQKIAPAHLSLVVL